MSRATDSLVSSAPSRYELLVRVASGGMATVFVGRIRGASGFTRLVAIKRAHPHLLEDQAFARALAAEARVASMIQHPNVCSVQDVEELEGEIHLVMDYVEGATLAGLATEATRAHELVPPEIAIRILLDACAGLHAAHELTNDQGVPLGLIHRDVSPHNILVGLDGVTRLADFGIARVTTGSMTISGPQTTTGVLKGKVGYMAPEYVETSKLDARADIFALGVVAWEALTQRRLFRGQSDIDTLRLVLACEAPLLSSVVPSLGSFDAIVARALARSPADRFQTAHAFGAALEAAAQRANLIASSSEVGAFVGALVGPSLEARRAAIRAKSSGEHEEDPVVSATTPVFAPLTGTSTLITPPGSHAQPAAADVVIGRKTLTLPIVTPPFEQLQARLPFQSEPTNTIAAGAAAITIDTSDPLRAPPSRKLVPIVIGVLVAMVGLTSVGFFVTNAKSKAPANGSVAPIASLSSVSSSPLPPEKPSAAPVLSTPAVVALPSAKASPKPSRPIALPARSPPSREPAHPPPPSLETAPPNPYAR